MTTETPRPVDTFTCQNCDTEKSGGGWYAIHLFNDPDKLLNPIMRRVICQRCYNFTRKGLYEAKTSQ